MSRFLAALATFILSWSFPAMAQDEQPETITLPFQVEVSKPITFQITTTNEQGGARFVGSETIRVTPLRADNEAVLYEAESLAAALVSAEGLPPHLSPVLEKLAAEVVGMKYQYRADTTGLPLLLTEHKQINKFMKKAGQDVEKWVKKFARSQKLNEQQVATVLAVVNQSLAPMMTEDTEALSRVVLEQGQLMFAVTGRQFFVGYYAESQGTRYFEPGQAYFYTQDNWHLESYDEATGEAVAVWDSVLHPEEYEAFLGRYKQMLTDQHGVKMAAAIEQEVDKYRKLQLNRTARYVIDLATGLPKEGTIRSEQVFMGQSEVEEVTFTSSY